MAFASSKLRDPSFGISLCSNSFCKPESNGFPLVSIKYATLSLRKNNKSRVSIILFLNVRILVMLCFIRGIWFSLSLIINFLSVFSSLVSLPLSGGSFLSFITLILSLFLRESLNDFSWSMFLPFAWLRVNIRVNILSFLGGS